MLTRYQVPLPVFQVDWNAVNGSHHPSPLVSQHVSPWELRLKARTPAAHAAGVRLKEERRPSHQHGETVAGEAPSLSHGQGHSRMQLVHEAYPSDNQSEAPRLLHLTQGHPEHSSRGDYKPEDSSMVFECQVQVSWCMDHNTAVMQVGCGFPCPSCSRRGFPTHGLTSKRKFSHGTQDPSSTEEDDLTLSLSL